MRFAHFPSLVLFIAVTICAAAFPPRIGARQSQIPSERTVGPLVDFIALNADGSPVADLLPSEVEIKIGDRPRVIRQLRRVSAGEASHAAGRLPPPYGTNSDISTGRRFMIVIDQESIAAGREQLFRSAVEGLLSELTSADRTMVAALPFGGIVVPFTSDIARIRLATGRITGQGSRTETGSDRACRTRRFLESMMGMLQAGGTEDSPQTLIVFTDGMAAPRRDAPAGLRPGMCELQIDLFRDLAEVTSRARANVYIMQPADIGIRTSLPRATIGGTSDIGSENPLEGLEHLAGVTGGTRLALDASGTGSLLRVAKESTGYYAAELEPANGEVFNRARSVAVRVSRRGVTVRVRPEIVFTDKVRPSGKTRLAVPDLLSSAEAVADLPLRVGGFTVRDADGKLRVGVLVEPVDATVALASAGAILIEGTGRVAAHWHARDATERPLLGAMTAPAGRYRIRAAAIDGAGRPGAAEAEVEVGLIDVGALSLGSLLLSASRGGTTSLQLEFSTEPTARASFDIYGGSEGQRVAAVLELARDLDGPAMSTVPLALTRADAARVVATGTIPLGALPPGDYVVRGIIRLEDGTTGRVVRTLRKKTR